MTNDSYIAESYYDSVYERNENVGTHTCTTCHGDGVEEISDCCGAKINHDDIIGDMYCSDCLNQCKATTDTCEDCNGSGEMEND